MYLRLAIGLLGLLTAANVRADDTASPVVVELFTSQGCSSCPPADVVLSRLAERPDVLALSFHVDYWDRLGWKDPFSSPLNTGRQMAYRVAFHNAQIYTPQIVIGGTTEVVGHDAMAASAAISDMGRRRTRGPKPVIARAGDIIVAVPAGDALTATIWIAAYDPRHETAVRLGENSGSVLVNTNVVRRLLALGPYTGHAITLTTPTDFARDDQGIAAWIQIDPAGAIVGAANTLPTTTRNE